MSDDHTSTPWTADPRHGIVTAADGRTLVCDCRAPTLPHGEVYQAAEDARRIAACGNACAGLTTAALESGVVAELAAACEALLAAMEEPEGPELAGWDQAIAAGRAALAKARGS